MRLVSFFAGAGGLDLGFLQAGYKIVGAYEWDKHAVASYKANIDESIEVTDVTSLTGADIPDAEVWSFGFPCQDLSTANKNAAGLFEGKRSSMFFEIMRLLEEVEEKPPIILAENVKGLKKYLPVLEESYKKAGYKMVYTMYNSKHWGLSQNRERYFVVGVREDLTKEFVFPVEQTEYIPELALFLEDDVDEKFFMKPEHADPILSKLETKYNNMPVVKSRGKLRETTDRVSNCLDANYSCGVDNRGQRTRIIIHNIYGGFGEKEPRVFTEYSPTIRTASGGGHIPSVVEKCFALRGRMKEDKWEQQVEFRKDTVTNALTSVQKDNLLFNSNEWRIRKLTPRETANLQGFPKSYKQVVSNTQFYRQMGNAVSVPVAYVLATTISDYLK